MDDLKGLLADSSSKTGDRAARRMKLDNPEIAGPSNLNQYQHKVEVLWKIEKVANYVLKGDGESAEKFPARRSPQRQHIRPQNCNPNFRQNQPFRDSISQSRDYQPPQCRGHDSYNNNNCNQNRTEFRRDRFDRKCHICRRRGHLLFDCPERGQRR